jgi:hypothetical protein
VDDRAADGQAQAGALARRGPVEALEDQVPLRWRDARAAVVHQQLGPAGVADGHADAARLGRVLARVVQQDAEQAIQPLLRGEHEPVAVHGQVEPLLPGRGAAAKALDRQSEGTTPSMGTHPRPDPSRPAAAHGSR